MARADALKSATFPFRRDDEALAFVAHSLADARIVGFGMTMRGVVAARALYAMQTQLVLFLVRHMGAEVILIEDGPEAGEAIDAWINGGNGAGIGGAQGVLAKAWGVWRTAEFAMLLDALRAINASRETHDRIHVRGADTDSADPDAGFFASMTHAAARSDRLVIYLGGLCHVAHCPLELPNEARARRPAGLRALESGLAYKSVALAVGEVSGLADPPKAPFLEAELSDLNLDQLWLDVARARQTGRLLDGSVRLRACGPSYDKARDLAASALLLSWPQGLDAIAYAARSDCAQAFAC